MEMSGNGGRTMSGKTQKKKISLENYLDIIHSHKQLDDLNIANLKEIISMHGFKKMETTKNVLIEAVKTMELMDLSRSTLQEEISSEEAVVSVDEAIKDLTQLNWQECCVASLQTICFSADGVVRDYSNHCHEKKKKKKKKTNNDASASSVPNIMLPPTDKEGSQAADEGLSINLTKQSTITEVATQGTNIERDGYGGSTQDDVVGRDGYDGSTQGADVGRDGYGGSTQGDVVGRDGYGGSTQGDAVGRDGYGGSTKVTNVGLDGYGVSAQGDVVGHDGHDGHGGSTQGTDVGHDGYGGSTQVDVVGRDGCGGSTQGDAVGRNGCGGSTNVGLNEYGVSTQGDVVGRDGYGGSTQGDVVGRDGNGGSTQGDDVVGVSKRGRSVKRRIMTEYVTTVLKKKSRVSKQ
ncbi:PREDICTED: stress protein DDR48 isoform X2 [Nicotiana attenuata]|uniref:stress protein DDR48 isoform X2 n=1 Tax=Nicotiana attenuata TaxID=49451 RepID=UPI000905AC4E|nr:PREDICTED: stress protein DDR48 isoform X2 [Nicotiana attenuata]